jgi:exopolyphosphatase/guanosine-5'-triphosphate,3'-diphosphate pyrophosphatase
LNVYGAIDIGSNAARLLICEVFYYQDEWHYKKRSLVRMPLRLGEDVFTLGSIPEAKARDMEKSVLACKLLMEVNGVERYKAVATSAMREAANGQEIANSIQERTGVSIEIIPGKVEAKLLYATHFEEMLDRTKSYMYVDVGGGSTEVSIFANGVMKNIRSFNIGTIRLKNNQVQDSQWNEMKSWIEIHTSAIGSIEAIGSGGNINKLYKLNGSRADKKITYAELEKLYKEIEAKSFIERIIHLGMRSDRADVILPATRVFMKVMRWAGIKDVYVPKFGLSDGIIRILAKQSQMAL